MTHENEMTPPSGYDHEGISLPKVSGIALVSLLLLVFLAWGGRSFFLLSKENTYREQVLQMKSEQLLELREHEHETLSTYGVVDREKGLYRIPIQKAMEQVAHTGK